MWNKLKKKIRGERGDSTLVSTILVIPLIVGILITMIDVSVYFANRGQVLETVRDGARQVAIFGGDGSATQATPLQKAYGLSRASTCSGLASNAMVKEAYSASSSAVECGVLKNIANTNGLISIRVTGISCGAATSAGAFTGSKTSSIGQQVGCDLTWRYDSIPGSGLSFMTGLSNKAQKTKVNTTSEVSLNNIKLQNW